MALTPLDILELTHFTGKLSYGNEATFTMGTQVKRYPADQADDSIMDYSSNHRLEPSGVHVLQHLPVQN